MHHCNTTNVSVDWIRHAHACSNAVIDSGNWSKAAMQIVTGDPVTTGGLSNLGTECAKMARRELFFRAGEGDGDGDVPPPFVLNYDAIICSLVPRAIETALLLLCPSATQSKRRHKKYPVIFLCDGISELPTWWAFRLDKHNRVPWKTTSELAEFVESVAATYGLDISNVNLQYALRSDGTGRTYSPRSKDPSLFYDSPIMRTLIHGHSYLRDARHGELRLCVVSHSKFIRAALDLSTESGPFAVIPNVSVHRQYVTYGCDPATRMTTCTIHDAVKLWAPDPVIWNRPKHLLPSDVVRCKTAYRHRPRAPVRQKSSEKAVYVKMVDV